MLSTGGENIHYLDLRLGHAQGECQLGPLGSRQILGLLERLLQRENLLAREGGPRVLLLAVGVDRVTMMMPGRQIFKEAEQSLP